MNKEQISGIWDELKGKIESEWGSLTEDPGMEAKGDFTQLFGYLQKTYGWDKEQAKKESEKFNKMVKEVTKDGFNLENIGEGIKDKAQDIVEDVKGLFK